MKLSNSQKSAIAHFNGPALILAVPGAGKTTVLIHRIANLINEHSINPKNILSITFSKSSANDMKDRFNKLYPSIRDVHFSTIHSFAYSIVNNYGIKNNKRYTLLESEKSPISKYELLKKLYYNNNHRAITDEKLETLATNISFVKNMLLEKDEIKEYLDTDVEKFIDIYYQYEIYKDEKNLIDFDDMLTLCLEILKSDGIILSYYRDIYKYIQVDEAQDTSKVQIEIIKLLAYPNNNLFIVADDDQSIYGFRGAYPEELFHFEEIYNNSKIFYMEDNYRSTKNIVTVSSRFINQNNLRFKKTIVTDNPIKDPINISKVVNLEKQYDFLVKNLIENDDYNNTAILYRNNLSAIGVMNSLSKNNIPFYNRDTKLRFFNHFILRDISNFLRLSYDTTNIGYFERIYFKMRGFTSRIQLDYIKKMSSQGSVFSKLLEIPDLNSFYQNNFYELEKDFNRLSKLEFKKAVSFIEYQLGYEDYLRDSAKKFGQTYESLKNILQLIKIIGEECVDLDEFLNKIKNLNNLAKNKKYSGITLSTIHSAKGLEFNNVYIIDMIKGEFPNNKSLEKYLDNDIKAYEEERRLFYVAMTRAKDKLTLIVPANKTPIFESSIFIDELRKLV